MFFPMGSEMREGPVNNTGLSEEKLDEMVLRARHPKINRSALMRVAMEELEKYPDDKLQEVIANYFKNDLENN